MSRTIYLVGEGKTDIGTAGPMVLPGEAQEGVVQVLVRKVLGADSKTLQFKPSKVSRFPKERGKLKGPKLDGEARSAYDAYVLASTSADGFIMVRDSDNTGDQRLGQMQAGITTAQSNGYPRIPHACGLAIETIEAWVIAALPNSGPAHAALPRGKRPEDLWGKPGDSASDHPKQVCARALAAMGNTDDLASKVAVVDQADVATLEQHCPRGFAMFARDLRAAFSDWFPDD